MTEQNPAQTMSKKKIRFFLILVFTLVAFSYITIFLNETPEDSPGLILLQWSPAIAALITLFVYQRNIRGLGWGWGKTRYQLISIILPFVITLIVYLAVWFSGTGLFYNHDYIEMIRIDMGGGIESDYLIMLIIVATNILLGWAVTGIFALGEEIGWRGFLLPELAKNMSFTRASLISGVIWAVYHYPLFIFIVAPELDLPWWFILPVATISGIGISVIVAWLRLKSNSLWTAVLFHAYLNIHIQGFFDQVTVKNDLSKYFSGEQGIFMAVAFTLVAFYFWSKRSEISTPSTNNISQEG